MDIFGHARAAKFFGENSKGGEFFPFVNGEGVSLILGRSIFYLHPPPPSYRGHILGISCFPIKGGGGVRSSI